MTFTATIPPGRGTRRRRSNGYAPNTGMELLSWNAPQPFAFCDVASPDPMLRALDQARRPV